VWQLTVTVCTLGMSVEHRSVVTTVGISAGSGDARIAAKINSVRCLRHAPHIAAVVVESLSQT
jgi:hypothetical protein